MVSRKDGCPFCEIAEKPPPGVVLKWWHIGECFAIEPLYPVTPGHVIVMPFEHIPDATTSPGRTGQVVECAADYARTAGITQLNLITSVGAAATQTVRHLHVHVVPRREGDGLHLPWTGQVKEVGVGQL